MQIGKALHINPRKKHDGNRIDSEINELQKTSTKIPEFRPHYNTIIFLLHAECQIALFTRNQQYQTKIQVGFPS